MERCHERVVEQVVVFFFSPQVVEGLAEMDQVMVHERISDCNVEQNVDVPVPQILKESVETIQSVPQECSHQRMRTSVDEDKWWPPLLEALVPQVYQEWEHEDLEALVRWV